jgi:hypothetical protein
MDKDTTKVAEKIFKAVKDNLASARKYNKEKGFDKVGIRAWGRKSQMVDLGVEDNNEWINGHRNVRSYTINVNGKEMGEFVSHYDISEVFSKLRNLLNEQKKIKGWSGLNFNSESVELASCSWSGYNVSIIPKVCLADAPCKEYNSLMNYLNKFLSYGKIGNYEFFSSAMGGKRGVLWDEYGERCFLDNKPKKCASVLAELRKAKGSKDTLTIKRGEENYIDEIDRKYSEYHEVECEGEKRKYVEITIKTPTGKVKYQQKIY